MCVLLSLYDLANIVPTLAKFYHQASEAYEQACTRHISMIIYVVSNFLPLFFIFFWTTVEFISLRTQLIITFFFSLGKQFERLFQFARRIEDLMFTVAPEEVGLYYVFLLILHSLWLYSISPYLEFLYNKLDTVKHRQECVFRIA